MSKPATQRPWFAPLALTLALLVTLLVQNRLAGSVLAPADRFALPPLPSDPGAWINSSPLSRAELAGEVVLLHFWAFECWNCYRSFPWLNGLGDEIDDPDFRIVGVHTPEFEREKERTAVIARARHFELEHPVLLDNDYAYWRAMGNRFWPAWYLVDRSGTVRSVFVGETHAGDPQARRIADEVRSLLAEG